MCVATEDSVLHMFEYNLNTKGTMREKERERNRWRQSNVSYISYLLIEILEVPSQNRNDDHLDAITSVCGVNKLRLFVTSSRDGSIKVWNVFHSMIR